jgi:hypothetical protein
LAFFIGQQDSFVSGTFHNAVRHRPLEFISNPRTVRLDNDLQFGWIGWHLAMML